MADISAQQQQFVNEYLTQGNATKAAVAAGYSEKTAQAQGSRLLKQPSIKQMIEASQQAASIETQITIHDLLAELEAARLEALAQGQCGAAISATMGKAKLLGLDKPQANVMTTVNPTRIELVAPTRIIREFVDVDGTREVFN